MFKQTHIFSFIIYIEIIIIISIFFLIYIIIGISISNTKQAYILLLV